MRSPVSSAVSLGVRNVGVGCVIVILCVAVSLGTAQESGKKQPTQPEIRGVVTEAGVSQPVPDADVSLIRLPGGAGPRIVSALTPKDVVQTTKTGASGAFVFKVENLGDYRVEVYKDGYQPAQNSAASVTVTLSDQDSSQELKFMLVRPGELSGRVIDEETEEPVPMLRVIVAQRRYARGRPIAWPAGQATADAGGRFVVRDLQPGDYLVRPASRMYSQGADKTNPGIKKYGEPLVLTQFSDDDLKAISWDYEQTWWPGGWDLRTAYPTTLASGAAMNLGDLPARKRRVYSVRVSVLAPSCAANTGIQVNAVPLSDRSAMTGREGRVPCGKEFLMRGFAPGSYRLEAVVEGLSRDTRERGSATFDVVNENVKLSIPVARGVDIEGKVVLAEGARALDFKTLDVRLGPIGWVNVVDEISNPIDEEGRFRVVNVAIRDHQLYVSGLKAPYYIKEFRYNGNPVSVGVVSLDGRTTSHSLEIIVDDKPAAIWGTVTDRDRPVNQPHVVLVRWPPNANDPYLSLVASVDGDKNGKFQLGGLPPGEYRMFAVEATARAKLDQRDVLERMVSDAQKITLSERGFRNITLGLAEMQ